MTAGKGFAAILAFVGIAIIAVPAGLVASALAKAAQREDTREEEDQ